MMAMPTLTRRARSGWIAVLLPLSVLACAPGGTGDKGPAAPGVSVDEVREQVRLYSMGGGEKDEAGEKFYNWGEAAHSALAELARDPGLTDTELDAMMMIVAVYAHTPGLFDALRTRIGAIPDPEARAMRLGLLEHFQASPGVAVP
jgi:hypothetical protein